MYRIVFVEDDPEIGMLISSYLGRHDMEVILETNGDNADAVVQEQAPDLVMLDVMLAGKDGISICRELRTYFAGPIVLLTALDSDINHILSLELGANDYILKTTPPSVLLARLRLHLRTPPQVAAGEHGETATQTQQKSLTFGQLHIDPSNRKVILNRHPVTLSTADFDLLWILCSHAGKIMLRDDLLKTLHGRNYDGMDRSIDVSISRLRRKLDDDPDEPTRIITIRNKGYLFAPDAWE